MKNNLFNIDESEKRRILEMHESATKKLYLGEQQAATAPTTTTQQQTATQPSTTAKKTPGIFTWIEDDPNSKTMPDSEKSKTNFNNLQAYYAFSESGSQLPRINVLPKSGEGIDPWNVYDVRGKIVYIFNGGQGDTTYLKSNLADQFVVKNIEAGSSKRQNTNQGTLNLMEGDTLTSGKYFIIFPNRTLFQYYPSFQKLKQNVTSPVTLITTTYQSPLINQD